MSHTCHARGCEVPVPPAMFMCKRHWFTLPKYMRDAVWRHYRQGQENDKRPTSKYLEVTAECIDWLWEREQEKKARSDVQ